MDRKAEPGPRDRRMRGRAAWREATHGKPGPRYDQQVQGLDLFFFLNKVYFWYGKKIYNTKFGTFRSFKCAIQ